MIYRTTVLRGHMPAQIGCSIFAEHADHKPLSMRHAAAAVAELLGQSAAWLRVYLALQAAGHLPKSAGGRIEPATPTLVGHFIIGLLTHAAGGHLRVDGFHPAGKPDGAPMLLSEQLAQSLGQGPVPFSEVEFCPELGWAIMRMPSQADRIFLLS